MGELKVIKVRLIIADHYLSFHHGLFKGMILDATPRYTSTKRLKGYGVDSKKTGTDLFVRTNEIEIM